jgi:5,10-methylenetetrahydromethanopterin reductase
MMRIGIFLGEGGAPDPLEDLVARTRQVARDGFPSVWVSHIFGADALISLAVMGREVPEIELGSAVIPTYPRHPLLMAQQALTTQVATRGRLTLGIGLSHRPVIEGMFGHSFEKPARHMREYLQVLLPALRQESVDVDGETVRAHGTITIPGATPCPVLLAALAPRMLRLAGGMADGTITWMTGLRTVAEHIVPSITAAAEDAGKPPPRVVVGLPVCVTDDVEAARRRAARTFALYGQLPSYRAMFDREGAGGPADVLVAGDEAAVREQLTAFSAAGATDFLASEFGSGEERARTRALLAGWVAAAV